MKRMKELEEYVQTTAYRKALELPTQVEETYELLAQGEYHINYQFVHPLSGKRLLLRVNCGSQMHLKDQIGYEFRALRNLEASGRTPQAIYVDGSCTQFAHGILVMEYLPGRSLDYRKDWEEAARILADVHSTRFPNECVPAFGNDSEEQLFYPKYPLRAMLQECEQMVQTYLNSPLARAETKQRLRRLLQRGWQMVEQESSICRYACCINTELNSTNFLIPENGEKGYLIDWEKPIYGTPAQDLGHFLAPTTTRWKSDVTYSKEEMRCFFEAYIQQVAGRFPTKGLWEETERFLPITCLRGVTWCAMAWVEYQQPNKLIANASTKQKLDAYLEDAFLDALWEEWFHER